VLPVHYAQIRDRIENGDVLLFRGSLLQSRFIQRWTRSVYSHVGLALWIRADGVKRLTVIEAMEGRGVRLFPLSEYLARGDYVDWFAITEADIRREKVVAWAMARLGRDYASAWQLLRSFGFVTKRIANRLGLPTKVDHDRWFCSWFAAQALRAGGWVPAESDRLPPEQYTPGDIALFPCLQRRGKLERNVSMSQISESMQRSQ
jgi:hypothetical protein